MSVLAIDMFTMTEEKLQDQLTKVREEEEGRGERKEERRGEKRKVEERQEERKREERKGKGKEMKIRMR